MHLCCSLRSTVFTSENAYRGQVVKNLLFMSALGAGSCWDCDHCAWKLLIKLQIFRWRFKSSKFAVTYVHLSIPVKNTCYKNSTVRGYSLPPLTGICCERPKTTPGYVQKPLCCAKCYYQPSTPLCVRTPRLVIKWKPPPNVLKGFSVSSDCNPIIRTLGGDVHFMVLRMTMRIDRRLCFGNKHFSQG